MNKISPILIDFKNRFLIAKNNIGIIKQNVFNYQKIKQMAISENISYPLAKIMYNNGQTKIDKETAEKILQLTEKEHIPLSLISELNIVNINSNKSEYDLCYIYNKIADYANRSIINELNDYIFSKYNYGKQIYELMMKGYNIDDAIKILDEKIKLEMQINGLSELAAWSKLLYLITDIAATEFEKIYKDNEAIKYKPIETVKRRIMTTSKEYKRTTINGITLISKTEEGLHNLEQVVNDAYSQGKDLYLENLSENAKEYELFVTDFSINSENSSISHYDNSYCYIFLANQLDDYKKNTFFHETSHFLDDVIGREVNNKSKYYSADNIIIFKTLEKIRNKINVVPRGLSLAWFETMNEVKYINNKELNQKWLMEIKQDKPYLNDIDLKYFLQQKKMYERKKYRLLSIRLQDIYDGLTKGKLHDFGDTYGHGRKYFSNPNNVSTEFIANIGVMYNSGGKDFLEFELGEELATQLINLYIYLIIGIMPDDEKEIMRRTI
ncbi:MAG: hypothetical protein IJR82_05255 [Bacilli bacterium]|nr:hypothetical protein [Bacilli bacterium]